MSVNAEWQFNRKFYDLSEVYRSRESPNFGVADGDSGEESDDSTCLFRNVGGNERTKLMAYTDKNVIGRNLEFSSPFGVRRAVYCDYTASGRSLSFVEDYILRQVLPSYGNTHTTSSVTSLQTTLFRHEARELLRNAVGASESDAVVFVGSGCTGAIHKLIKGLNLKEKPIVFVGPTEHHSNLLPWREVAERVVCINEGEDGLVDLEQLEAALKSAKTENRRMIGCFSAASNITGVLAQDLVITSLLKKYGGSQVEKTHYEKGPLKKGLFRVGKTH